MLNPDDLLLNRYRIEALLGEGGMGAVYRAHDQNLSVTVAIKENLVITDASRRQFEREARLLAGMRHPSLPRVTDHFQIPGQGQYLVMDFVEGEDLSARLTRSGRMPEAEAVRWAEDVLDALAYLHGRGIIHRDIKPANIKITPDGRAVLVDFGIAKVGTGGQTSTGARGLTPGFAPPEQHGFGSTDPRSDLYSLGATLYTALTGRIPVDAITRMVQQLPLTPLRQLAPGVGARTAQAIETALAMKPDERWPSAQEMQSAIQPPTAPVERRAAQPTLYEPTESVTQVDVPPAPAAAVPLPRMPAAPLPKPDTSPRPVTAPAPARPNRALIGLGVLGLLGLFGAALLAAGAYVAVSLGLVPGVGGRSGQPFAAGLGPGTGQIAFVSDRDGNLEIYMVGVDGSGLVNLTNNSADEFEPAFSPDGEQIAFASNRTGDNEIYFMDADGSNVVQVTNNPAEDNSPAWSSNGQLAFVSDRDGNFEIYVLSESGTLRYSDHPAADITPAWSRTGELLAFSSARDGNFEIYVFGPDGLTRYTNSAGTDSYPRWSPARDILAFESNRNGDFDIHLFGEEGLIRHTSHPADDGEPAWSPDGSQILFTSDRDGNPEIYVFSQDGLTRVTDHPAQDANAAWQP